MVAGPTAGSGYTFWQVAWPDVTGWTAGAYLILVTPSAAIKPVVSLSINPTSLVGSGQAVLSYSVSTNATAASIDNGVGSVSGSGTKTVQISSSTTFTLTASNSVGSSTASTSIAVITPPPPIGTCDTAHTRGYNEGFLAGKALAIHDTISYSMITHDTLYVIPDSSLVQLKTYWGSALILSGQVMLKK